MDFESFGNLNYQEVNEIALTFMETLAQATGKTPIIYSDLYNARDLFDEQLAAYPLWIAEYGASTPGDPGKWDSWVGFQYSSSGSVPGIDGRVDMDKDVYKRQVNHKLKGCPEHDLPVIEGE